MTQIADIADRLRRLAKRREDDGIYTDATLCDDAARALQAVGPEPAVAVKPLEWKPNSKTIENSLWVNVEEINRYYTIDPESNVFRLRTQLMLSEWGSDDLGLFPTVEAAKAAGQADHDRRIASRIRSALVATPPAEPMEGAPTADVMDAGVVAALNSGFEIPRSTVWNVYRAVRAALATKPAVKDDETVVEAAWAVLADWNSRLPDGPEVHMTNRERDFSYWSPSASMVSAEAMSKLRAALAAKDGRS